MSAADPGQPQIKSRRVWRGVFAGILSVCLFGFLSGVGMLNGSGGFAILALGLTFVLGILWIGAIAFSLAEFKHLGAGRALAVFLVPPLAWYGTITMVNTYPTFISRIYFRNHQAEYEEAVKLTEGALAPEKFVRIELPPRLRNLSIDGHMDVSSDTEGRVSFTFAVGQGFMTYGPYIRYIPVEDPKPAEDALEKLAPKWYMVPAMAD